MLDDGRPIFVQIAESIADGILAGTYAEGTQVPSTNELSAFHRINPATVGKGLGLLVDRDILHKRRGLGMFVSDGARQRLRDERTASFRADFVVPLLTEARSLGLELADIHRIIDQEGERS
ncbi:GntR family transcriptional regulator [Microbacterium sp. SORGH_AS_0888]|uniref:GntR family transcriptional regulator n=1 Tax=Microbacterium sp. SORGH_AS_0888 TaxID=3041791 RepID=UPI00277E0A23|nr:GntR family transcriptional regulator [Microbacterium sp. SORGH_AS_0888]MDQ1128381.1 GntR family transcriptional regulator [Microbacterium sp. SORGH_AS_0888]